MACPHPEAQQVGGACYFCCKSASGLMGGRAHPEDLTPEQRIFVGFDSPTFGATESRNGWKQPSASVLESWAAAPEPFELSMGDRAFLQNLLSLSPEGPLVEDWATPKRGGQRSWG